MMKIRRADLPRKGLLAGLAVAVFCISLLVSWSRIFFAASPEEMRSAGGYRPIAGVVGPPLDDSPAAAEALSGQSSSAREARGVPRMLSREGLAAKARVRG